MSKSRRLFSKDFKAKDDLFSLKAIKPSKEIFLNFDKIIYPYFQKQNKIEEENPQLASLRDWLFLY